MFKIGGQIYVPRMEVSQKVNCPQKGVSRGKDQKYMTACMPGVIYMVKRGKWIPRNFHFLSLNVGCMNISWESKCTNFLLFVLIIRWFGIIYTTPVQPEILEHCMQ